MKHPHAAGQALAESIVLLAVLLVFFSCGTWLLRHAGHAQVLQASAAASMFQQAYQHASPPVVAASQQQDLVSGPLSTLWQGQYEPLHLGGLTIYGVQASREFAVLPGLALGPTHLRRHSYWLMSTGHANDDQQVRERLEASESLWGQAAWKSQALLARLGPSYQSMEGYWGRSAPQTDWLKAWQRYVPDSERLP